MSLKEMCIEEQRPHDLQYTVHMFKTLSTGTSTCHRERHMSLHLMQLIKSLSSRRNAGFIKA